MFYVVQEIMHQVALLPLAVMLVLMRTTSFGAQRWTLAAALAVSWMMDSVNFAFVSDDLNSIIAQYGKPIQIALILGVVVNDRRTLITLLAGLVVAVFASAAQGAMAREIVVPVLGGFVISLYAWRLEKDYMRSGLLVHFGLGAIAWIAWSVAATEPTRAALVTWFTFQGTRLIGILLITAALIQIARKPRIALV